MVKVWRLQKNRLDRSSFILVFFFLNIATDPYNYIIGFSQKSWEIWPHSDFSRTSHEDFLPALALNKIFSFSKDSSIPTQPGTTAPLLLARVSFLVLDII